MSDVDRAFRRIRAKIKLAEDKVKEQTSMKFIGNFGARLIRKRTRLGYGSNNGKKERLEKLSPLYKKQRKKFSGLSSKTTAGKSNLTRTGQMLDSIKSKVTGYGQAEIYLDGSRDDDLTNDKVREYVEDNGRPFFNFTTQEEKQITRIISKRLKTFIREIFK
jgi:hypothetical protein